MKINLTYLVLALVLFALWGLRRLGVDDATADTITTFLVLGLGATPSMLANGAGKVPKITPLLLVLALSVGCATTKLDGCTIDVSRSDPARDVLTCANHEPIQLPNLNPKLRALILQHFDTGGGGR